MVRPKKHLGQHFLKDQNIARKIVRYLSKDTQNLIEIGPGTGVLSQHLEALKIPCYCMIEIDRESVFVLKQKFPELSDYIISGDFLKYDLNRVFTSNFSVIGNFPYNISSQILFRILDYRSQVEEVVGMFQKEVAERICAPAGSKKYGILSVLLQAFYQIEFLFTVSEKVFYPEPKVKSAVIRLTRNQTQKLDCDESLFFSLVKSAFNQRRKTLRNALGKYEFANNPDLDFFLSKRAEQLRVDDFIFLTKQVIKPAKDNIFAGNSEFY